MFCKALVSRNECKPMGTKTDPDGLIQGPLVLVVLFTIERVRSNAVVVHFGSNLSYHLDEQGYSLPRETIVPSL